MDCLELCWSSDHIIEVTVSLPKLTDLSKLFVCMFELLLLLFSYLDSVFSSGAQRGLYMVPPFTIIASSLSYEEIRLRINDSPKVTQ